MSQKRERAANKCAALPTPPPAGLAHTSAFFCILRSGDWSGPAAKRTPSVVTLQRDLQLEREKHRRTQESVEQLRMEMQMMGRLMAAGREQLVALGAESLSHDVSVLMPQEACAVRSSRPPSESRHVQRLQDDLVDCKAQCKRLHEQAAHLQHKNKSLLASKKELGTIARQWSEASTVASGSRPGLSASAHACTVVAGASEGREAKLGAASYSLRELLGQTAARRMGRSEPGALLPSQVQDMHDYLSRAR